MAQSIDDRCMSTARRSRFKLLVNCSESDIMRWRHSKTSGAGPSGGFSSTHGTSTLNGVSTAVRWKSGVRYVDFVGTCQEKQRTRARGV